jgi:hypothetical protein
VSGKQYQLLKASGFLWVFYPEATGGWSKDKRIINRADKARKTTKRRPQ